MQLAQNNKRPALGLPLTDAQRYSNNAQKNGPKPDRIKLSRVNNAGAS